MIQNLDVFESDAIIIDLEDSVLLNDKDAARILVSQFLEQYQFTNTDIYIRTNDTNSSHFREDIAVLDTLLIKGYVLPKALPKDIVLLEELTDKDIIPIIESPMAFLRVEEIAQYNQVKGLLLGAEDFTKEMDINRSVGGLEIAYVRSHIAIVCHAYDILAIDTPYTGKEVDSDLLFDATNARLLGFTGKSIIHPNHVDTINEVFAPSKEEIIQSMRIIKKAEETGKGAFSLDGKMVDLPIIEKAKNVIEKAKRYKLL
jgi:citrate lyase subunit beta/citryl-CoA lyase